MYMRKKIASQPVQKTILWTPAGFFAAVPVSGITLWKRSVQTTVTLEPVFHLEMSSWQEILNRRTCHWMTEKGFGRHHNCWFSERHSNLKHRQCRGFAGYLSGNWFSPNCSFGPNLGIWRGINVKQNSTFRPNVVDLVGIGKQNFI